MMTAEQMIIMELLEGFQSLRRDHIVRYMEINYGFADNQVAAMLSQLRYLGKVMFKGDYILLPRRAVNYDIAVAFDVAYEIASGEKIHVTPGDSVFSLFFNVEDGEDCVLYAVAIVKSGCEYDIASKLVQRGDAGTTFIIVLDDIAQRRYFGGLRNQIYAVHDGTKYRYYNADG